MAEGATVEGATRLQATCLAAASDLDAGLPHAARSSGSLVAVQARARAPRRTGRLAASITSRTEQSGAVVGTSLDYATPVHQGVPARGIGARPFLRDAAQAAQPVVVATYAGDVRRVVSQVKGA